MQEKTWFRWLILAMFTMCLSAGSWGLNSIPSLGPFIKETMHLSAVQVGALMSSFYLGTTIMAFSYSFYFDRFSVKTSLALGLSLIGGFVLLAGLHLNFIWFLCLFAIAGSGYGWINPAINKGIVAWFPGKIRGTVMSIKQIGVTLGSGISAAVLPGVAVHTSITVALAITGMITVGIGTITYFIYKEKSLDTKRIDKETQAAGIRMILLNRNLLICNIVGMIFVGAQFSFFMYLSLYMREEFHYSVIQAGFILSLASIGGAVGRISWGMISDFFERKLILMCIGMGSALFGLLLAWIPLDIPVIFLYLIVLGYGMTVGGFPGVIQAMVTELAEPRMAGVISGFTLSFIYLGTMVIPFLFGVMVDGIGDYRVVWTISAGSLLMASGLLLKVQTQKSLNYLEEQVKV